jgi:hypothetical protein
VSRQRHKARNLELVPAKHVVQAWRSQAWPEGVYSIVNFELAGGWMKMYRTAMDALLSAT